MRKVDRGLQSVVARLVDDSEDRLGFRRVVLEQQWFDGHARTSHDGDGGAGNLSGLVLTSIDISANDGGSVGVTRWTYEGMVAETKADQLVCEMETRMSGAPIQVHPNWVEIEKYGEWKKVNKEHGEFPKLLNSGAKNPFWGVEEYLVPRATFSVTRSSKALPTARACRIEMPAVAPFAAVKPPEGTGQMKRNWLRMPMKAKWRGTGWEITESWQQSGAGGWIEDIYADTVSGSSKSSAGGLG
jgi:hypothetical protein